jgi:hypothetical protein
MISVTSVTDNYILQPELIGKHKKTVEWLSAAQLWKRELSFYQRLLDKHAPFFISVEDKKRIDHFQSIITYYKGELIDTFRGKLRQHERDLANMLGKHDETNVKYIKEHEDLMAEMDSLNNQLSLYKEEFFSFIERAIS